MTVVTLKEQTVDDYPLHPKAERICLDMDGQSNGVLDAFTANIHRTIAFRRTLKVHGTEVVIAFMTHSSILAILASVGLSCRVIVSVRNNPPNENLGRVWSLARRLVFRFADRVVVLTKESRYWIMDNTSCRDVKVIPNMIALPLPQLPGLVAPPSKAADTRMLLAVGRLVPQKGYPLLLEAFSQLASDFPDWQLYILGTGNRDEIHRIIHQLSLNTQVTIVGSVGNIEEWYRRADIYVLTSLFEGFPNSLLEAMASGCAVASFDCDSGPRDIINHGENGMLVNAGNVSDLIRVLGDLMNDEALRRRLAERSVDVLEKFSTRSVLSAWEEAVDMKDQDEALI